MSKSILNEKKTFKSSKSNLDNIEDVEGCDNDDEMKENHSREEMLNLPIFQKNRQIVSNNSSSSCSVSRNKPINVKKAEF